MKFQLKLASASLVLLLISACGSEQPQAEKETPISLTSVRVIKVEHSDIQPWIFGEGTARAIRREFLTFESAGRIDFVDDSLREGSPIKAGHLIAFQQPDRVNAELASAKALQTEAQTQLAVAKASQREAEANLSIAENRKQRFKVLLEKNSASQQEYDDANAQYEQARTAKIRSNQQIEVLRAQIASSTAKLAQVEVAVSEARLVSPIDGVLARLNIEKGYYFSPSYVQTSSEQGALATVPAVVIDPSAYEISVEIPSFAFQQVKSGAMVFISSYEQNGIRQSRADSDFSEDNFNIIGAVHAVSPSLDPKTRTFSVKIRTSKGAEIMQDGEYVTVWIAGLTSANVVGVPIDAVRYKNGQPYVFVYEPDTSFVHNRAIKIGAQGANRFEISSGLQLNELVVTDGRSELSNNEKVLVLPVPTER